MSENILSIFIDKSGDFGPYEHHSLQMLAELPLEQTAYIKIQTTDNMSKLSKNLDRLFKRGYKYVFIDEITLMEDFINTAAVLSDVFSLLGVTRMYLSLSLTRGTNTTWWFTIRWPMLVVFTK